MRAVRIALLAPALSLVLIAPGTGHALTYRPYASLYGGVSFLDEAGTSGGVETRFDTGFVVGGTLGAVVTDAFTSRIELDLNYRGHDVDKIGGTSNADGSVDTIGALANYWLDIVNRTDFTPYIGGGIGLAYINAADIEAPGFNSVDDEDVVFAWQLGGGVGWDITSNVTVGVDYRWFATSDPEFEDSTGSDFEAEYSSHNFMASVRYGF